LTDYVLHSYLVTSIQGPKALIQRFDLSLCDCMTQHESQEGWLTQRKSAQTQQQAALTAVFAISDKVFNVILCEAKAHGLPYTIAAWAKCSPTMSASHNDLPGPC